MKFRKKLVIIDAERFDGTLESVEKIGRFMGNFMIAYDPERKTLEIPTLEGIMLAQNGDWIIKGVKGEFYPCKPEIFEVTYEKVTQ